MTATTPKQETDDQENVIIVDWDGPNDPENPKKSVKSDIVKTWVVFNQL